MLPIRRATPQPRVKQLPPRLFRPAPPPPPPGVQPVVSQGKRWPSVRRVLPLITKPFVVIVVAAIAPVVTQGIPRRRLVRSQSHIVVQPPYTGGGIQPTIAQGVPRRQVRPLTSRWLPAPLYNSSGLLGRLVRGPTRKLQPQLRPRLTAPAPPAAVPAGIKPIITQGKRWAAIRRGVPHWVIAPPYNSGGIYATHVQGIKRGPTKPGVSRWLVAPPYNSSGILGQILIGIRHKPGPPGKPRLFQPPPPVVPPGIQPLVSQGKRWPAVRHTTPRWIVASTFTTGGIRPVFTQGVRQTAIRKILRPLMFTPPFTLPPPVVVPPNYQSTAVLVPIASPRAVQMATPVSAGGVVASPGPGQIVARFGVSYYGLAFYGIASVGPPITTSIVMPVARPSRGGN